MGIIIIYKKHGIVVNISLEFGGLYLFGTAARGTVEKVHQSKPDQQ